MNPPASMPTPADIAAWKELALAGLKTPDDFNKVYIALLSFVGGILLQVLVAYLQNRTQRKIADNQVEMLKSQLASQQRIAEVQASLFGRQLEIQREANLRVAQDNVAAKRQVWIDELRKDVSTYLATWQEIAWLWGAFVTSSVNEKKAIQVKANESEKNKGSATAREDADDMVGVGMAAAEKLAKFNERVAALRYEAHELQLRIRLRLNSAEQKHIELIELLLELELVTLRFDRTVSCEPEGSIQIAFRRKLEEVVSKLQVILKEEWIRVKNGEMPRDAAP